MKILEVNKAQDYSKSDMSDNSIRDVRYNFYTSTDGRIMDLENGIFFNNRLFSEKGSSIHNVAQTISDKLLSYKKKSWRLRRAAIHNIIANLFFSIQYNKVVLISRNANHYSGHKLHSTNHYTYIIMISMFNLLNEAGYIEMKMGYSIGNDSAKRTRIWAKNKLIELLNIHQPSSANNQVDSGLESASLNNRSFRIIRPDLIETPLHESDLVQFKETVKAKNKKCKRRIPTPQSYSQEASSITNSLLEYNSFMQNTYVIIDSNKYSEFQMSKRANQNYHASWNDTFIYYEEYLEWISSCSCNEEKSHGYVKTVYIDKKDIEEFRQVKDTDAHQLEEVKVSVENGQGYMSTAVSTTTGKCEYSDAVPSLPQMPTFQASIASPHPTITNYDYQNNPIFTRLNCSLYRVFGSTVDEGGRFYGAEYQQLPNSKEWPLRSSLLINGNPVTEADYSGLHMTMLYHLKRINFNGDPYDIGYDPVLRPIIKIMANIMINSKAKNKVVFSTMGSIYNDNDLRKTYFNHKEDHLLKSIHEKLIEKHQDIKEHFHSGYGIRLQKMDSDIAMEILLEMMHNDIPCLCVHDSFIVENQHKDLLVDMMRERYSKKFQFECDIKTK